MIRVAAIAQSQQRAMTASLQAQALAVSHATTATRGTNDDTPEKKTDVPDRIYVEANAS